jgi:hypothetical protein
MHASLGSFSTAATASLNYNTKHLVIAEHGLSLGVSSHAGMVGEASTLSQADEDPTFEQAKLKVRWRMHQV